MKRILLFSSSVALILAVAVVLLLYYGVILFNHPSREEFPVQGIDISHHQGSIRWPRIKKQKIDFVYIKATEGGDFVDSSFQNNWQQARELSLPVGAYHFFTLCRPGKEQAENFIATVPATDPSLPPAIDLEFTGNCGTPENRIDFDAEFELFFRMIKDRYRTMPVVYTTYEFMEKHDLRPYSERLWIRDIFRTPSGKIRWRFWQYTNRLVLPGIEGFVDGNVFAGSREEFRRYSKKDPVHRKEKPHGH